MSPDGTSPAAGHTGAESILPLVFEHVTLDAGRTRLIDGLSLRIDGGRSTIILGPNGAGKSLVLRLAHGLIRPSAGTVRWLGPAPRPEIRQAMLFQKPVLLRRNALANVAYPLRLRGYGRKAARERAAIFLERTGLAVLAGRHAHALSGGEQQRLALARAWALAPEVLFLDEPTSSLDPAAAVAVEAVIGEMRADGTTIVMTTHDLNQARRLADDVLFLHRGRLLEAATGDRFFAGPEKAEARAFIDGTLRW